MAYCARHGFIANDFTHIDRAVAHDYADMAALGKLGAPPGPADAVTLLLHPDWRDER